MWRHPSNPLEKNEKCASFSGSLLGNPNSKLVSSCNLCFASSKNHSGRFHMQFLLLVDSLSLDISSYNCWLKMHMIHMIIRGYGRGWTSFQNIKKNRRFWSIPIPGFTLVICYIATENGPFIAELPIQIVIFQFAMLVITRGYHSTSLKKKPFPCSSMAR